MNASPPKCDRCKTEPPARYVTQPREMSLCWGCYDEWRKWHFGEAYRYCRPIEELRQLYAYREAR